MDKKIITSIIVAVVVGGISFYGGMAYGKSSAFSNIQNLSTAERQQVLQQMRGAGGAGGFGGAGGGAGVAGRTGGRNAAGGATTGQIISKDDKSITVKMRDGGSKIVFYSTTTAISKPVQAASADLATGDQIIIMGDSNPDGSVNAKDIQIRPAQLNTPTTVTSTTK